MNCPICGYKKYKYSRYTEYGIGTVEQHGYCDRCGYTIEQAYSRPIEGFTPPIQKGHRKVYRDCKGDYYPKNRRKRARMKRKYKIKYGNKDWMLAYI